jgi:hypothetical protein
MKIKIPILVATLSLAVAMVVLSAAISMSARSRRAKDETAGLTDRIARLENELASARRRLKNAKTRSASTNELAGFQSYSNNPDTNLTLQNAESGSETNRQRESFEERMARMREEDPEGYAEFIQRRAERQQRIQYSFAERTATFMDLDTSYMTEKELANHEQLVQKMARIWELTQQFDDPEAPRDREAMRELVTEIRETRPLMKDERKVMFKQLGIDLGYDTDEASAFAEHLDEIIEATSLNMPRGGRQGR